MEMAHVLFMDIVAYSKLPMDQQHKVLHELQAAVRNTRTFALAQKNDKLISLPTGDGMALVFFGDPELPVRCALELGSAFRRNPEMKLRMGIHTGPVYHVADINAARNVAGGGINMAQRVMDCGDIGHILVSNTVADVLGQVSTWHNAFHDLGEAEVKHGVRVHIYNLCTEEAGNAELPQKFHHAKRAAIHIRSQARRKKFSAVGVAAIVVALAAGGWWYLRRPQKLTDKDVIVLSDFKNTTGDAVFDDTLRQGLSVQLEQSPFLDLLSEQKVNETLKRMGRPAGDRLTPEVTREVCQRSGSKAMLTGTIAGLGSQYVIGLKAVNCSNGDVLAHVQERAKDKEGVLAALDNAAVTMRAKLGESLSLVQKYATHLSEATTPSLEALKAYSLGRKTEFAKGDTAALPFYRRAVELDPNFATAYSNMCDLYGNLGESGRAAEYARKAYEFRDKVSERERFSIDSNYYVSTTGELEKAEQVYELWQQAYPRDLAPHTNLGYVSSVLGNYERSLEEHSEAMRLEPNDELNYLNLGGDYANLNRFDEAAAVYKQAEDRKLEGELLLLSRYQLAFLQGDDAGMARLAAASAGKAGAEDLLLASQSDTAGWHGKLKSAREMTRQAMDSAEHNDARETAAVYQAEEALREVESGNREQARAAANAAVLLAPNRDVRAMASLALARAGDTAAAEKLAADLDKTYPLDTLVQRYWLPTIRAAVALERKDAKRAVELLQVSTMIELASPTTSNVVLLPVYIRGEAFLMLHDGKAAAAEFQKFVDHRGLVTNFPWGAQARLGLARAYALQGDTAKAKAGYQDFLALWKDADPDLPVLDQAKAEYAKLLSH